MDASFPCPICGKPLPVAAQLRPSTFPFCDQRCRNRDLAAWSDAAYVVEGRGINRPYSPLAELDDTAYGDMHQ